MVRVVMSLESTLRSGFGIDTVVGWHSHVVPSDDVQPQHSLLHPAVLRVHPLEALLQDQVGGLIEPSKDTDDIPPIVGDDGDLCVHERRQLLRHPRATTPNSTCPNFRRPVDDVRNDSIPSDDRRVPVGGLLRSTTSSDPRARRVQEAPHVGGYGPGELRSGLCSKNQQQRVERRAANC